MSQQLIIYPEHITGRSNNKDWFNLPMEEVWKIMENYLFFCAHAFNMEVFAFVLMSNHFHLIARFLEGNYSLAILYFMRETSRSISKATGRINHNWGATAKPSTLKTIHYYNNCYKYLYRNPVRAGICENVEDYPFSTLQGVLGIRKMIIPMVEDTRMFNPTFDIGNLTWLNTPSNPEHEKEIARALRYREFKLATNRNTGKKSDLETKLI